ncbi:hydrogenase expression/formation protein HypE [Lachnospira pectinoschiza]|uniref:Hydrogenase expression/formation protein HypE n=1 Tax=Lachnospira pectinoschiza TaxID=28052 RepID=A0A1G9ZZJ1_9FIRM|nr:hydrogenase expression/formation protein HypE [Lachnospira pectinoschiza]SDN26311.1 hydrogenase expression/formation protein HypE [Lachnospira pectinoschiza]
MIITMAHGSGGAFTSELIDEIFVKEFDNETVKELEDCAVIQGSTRIAMTTDSFVVKPIEYPGGDIGRLCICGTVNDLLMRGAKPKYITCGFIIEEGADSETLKKIVHSMAETAKEAGVIIVAGDTKVIDGNGGIMINTAGVGFVKEGLDIKSTNLQVGDQVLLSGNLGDHHATILASRMNITNSIKSDNAPLNDLVSNLLKENVTIHTMRDVTRGGLATVLTEISRSSNLDIKLEENKIPVSSAVHDFCGLLGLDPLYMGNEGKCIVVLPKEETEKALEIIRKSNYGENAVVIGEVKEKAEDKACVYIETEIGGKRILDVLQGEGLPRIC